MGRKCIDLTGQKFGRLTVLQKSTKRIVNGCVCWVCICDCGNEKEISGHNLRSGKVVSCGCWNKEKIHIQHQDEYFKQQHKNGMTKLWNDEEFKQRRSVEVKRQMKDLWSDEHYISTHGEYLRQNFIGEKNPNWNGGTTPLRTYFAYIVNDWSTHAKQKVNFTCEITGEVLDACDLHTHHLYSFSNILKDIHEKNNIEIGKCIGDYTYEQLHIIEQNLITWHNDNSNAVVLRKDIHYLFHSIYGMGGNTIEQFKDFKEKYEQGVLS